MLEIVCTFLFPSVRLSGYFFGESFVQISPPKRPSGFDQYSPNVDSDNGMQFIGIPNLINLLPTFFSRKTNICCSNIVTTEIVCKQNTNLVQKKSDQNGKDPRMCNGYVILLYFGTLCMSKMIICFLSSSLSMLGNPCLGSRLKQFNLFEKLFFPQIILESFKLSRTVRNETLYYNLR